MKAFHPIGPERSASSLQLFRETFRFQLTQLEKNRLVLRVPRSRELYVAQNGMAYHFKPELFVQCAGETAFTCPGDTFVLGPEEVCVMPRGVPHGEIARGTDRAFENIVVGFYNETVAIHVAHEIDGGKPAVADIHFFTTEYYHDLVEYLNRIAELRFRSPDVAATAVKGLLMAELSLLLAIVEEQTPRRFTESERIFRCQWLVRNNLDDPTLSVAGLAKELRCSAGHLSAQFHAAMGERLVEHINRLRLKNAIDALRTTHLSIKEIAAASGYRDPNYFTRLFRQATGRSPGQYREDLRRVACSIETQPKVVFDDHAEFGFGLAPDVSARAEVHSRVQ